MGKSAKSQLAFAAKKCHPIKSFFVTKIPTTSDPAPRSAKTRKKTATTASTAFAAANESNKYTNISAHGDSIEEANVNPTNPSTNQNTNQYTNISAHGDSIEDANVNPTNPSTNQNTNQYTNISAHSQKLQELRKDIISLSDKEKRVTNKKIKEEVLQKITQFKAVLSVPNAFRPEHWKVLLSQMENGSDYTNQLFFAQSRVSQK
jgi:hypothetical protein